MSVALGHSYQQEWDDLFQKESYIDSLRSSSIKGELRNSHFRSICWKIFLECLPRDPQSWIESIKLQRKKYDEILDKFQTDPRTTEESMDINVNNPLSQSQQNPWIQYFQDIDLKDTIEQDVVRTFPEIEFFHTPEIQEMMISILFSYAREHPHISYKQGMHELLAPIIFVLHYDHEAYLQVSETFDFNLDIRIMLNQNYIEHDAFFLFCRLMEAAETWYTMSDSAYSKNVNLVSSEPFSDDSPLVSFLGLKLKNIFNHLLKQHDVELFSYLEQMEVTPQIFGIRWLRLLFGREFPIHDLLIIWDAIFADSITFDLVDYIFVAMLIAIRNLLLKCDYASCLQYLMHYPNIADVQYIIDLALHLKNPAMVKPVLPMEQISDFSKEKEVKSKGKVFTKTIFPKNVFTSIPKLPVDNQSNRPRTLKIPSINSSSDIVSDLVVGKNIQTSKKLNISCTESSKSENSAEPEISLKNENTRIYNTFPRTTICNVMENKNLKDRNLEVSQSFGFIDGKKILPTGALYRELVPLQANSKTLFDISSEGRKGSLKDTQGEIQILEKKILEIKTMNKYCAEQITEHIEKLQECMLSQKLEFENEMYIALAGLKKARDILKGTIAFTEEVADDDFSYIKQEYFIANNISSNNLNAETLLTKECKFNSIQNSNAVLKHKTSNNSENKSQDFHKKSQVPLSVAIETTCCSQSKMPDMKRL